MNALNDYQEIESTTTFPYEPFKKSISDESKSYTTVNVKQPGKYLSQNLAPILLKLNSFKSLSYNWDSYNAEKPSEVAIKNAIDFLNILDCMEIIPYYTVPCPNGEILLELKNGSKSIEIYFIKDGTNEVYFYEGNLNKYQDNLAALTSSICDFFYNG